MEPAKKRTALDFLAEARFETARRMALMHAKATLKMARKRSEKTRLAGSN
jgi:hypothetical protein